MFYLILGLIILLCVHSVPTLASGWRIDTRLGLSEQSSKGLYSVASILGLGLIVWGFSLARQVPVQLWSPPTVLRYLAWLLNLIAFVLLAAAFVHGNGIKAYIHHPLPLAVMAWALAHLLTNGNTAHVVLFGSFLLWAIFDYSAASRRDRTVGTPPARGATGATGVTVAFGVGAWIGFALWLHGLLMGVRAIG